MSPKESLQTFSAIRFFLYLQVITMLIILISHKLYVEGIAVKDPWAFMVTYFSIVQPCKALIRMLLTTTRQSSSST